MRNDESRSGVRIFLSVQEKAPSARPFAIDARVLEEDTYLVLSAEAQAREVRKRPRALLHEARDNLPLEPGTVLMRASRSPPLRVEVGPS